jgi:hypothetical protein
MCLRRSLCVDMCFKTFIRKGWRGRQVPGEKMTEVHREVSLCVLDKSFEQLSVIWNSIEMQMLAAESVLFAKIPSKSLPSVFLFFLNKNLSLQACACLWHWACPLGRLGRTRAQLSRVHLKQGTGLCTVLLSLYH